MNKLVQAALGDSGAASSAGELEAAAPATGVGLDAAAPSTSSAAATGGGAGGGAGADEASGAAVDIAEEYARAMQPLVTSRSMADKTKKAYPGHHWAKAIKKSLTQVRDDVALPLQKGCSGGLADPPVRASLQVFDRKTLRRVKAEIRTMKSSLPTHFNSTILVCHDKARPYVMQVAPSIQSHTLAPSSLQRAYSLRVPLSLGTAGGHTGATRHAV